MSMLGKNHIYIPDIKLLAACAGLIPISVSERRKAIQSGSYHPLDTSNVQRWLEPKAGSRGGRLVYEALLSRGYPEAIGQILTLAVDTKAFTPSDPAARNAIRAQIGLLGPVIGFVGRLTPEKGLHLLMRALERLGGDRPWSLMLLGSGPMERDLRRWASRRGWDERVWIGLARHDEVPDYLGAMDLLVAPSQTTRHWREQFGRMLIEAFACGVPIIASDSGEIPFVVGDAGIVLGERDEAGWAKAIGMLLDRPEMRAELAVRGLRRCRDYAVETVAEQYRQFYRSLAKRPFVPEAK